MEKRQLMESRHLSVAKPDSGDRDLEDTRATSFRRVRDLRRLHEFFFARGGRGSRIASGRGWLHSIAYIKVSWLLVGIKNTQSMCRPYAMKIASVSARPADSECRKTNRFFETRVALVVLRGFRDCRIISNTKVRSRYKLFGEGDSLLFPCVVQVSSH